MMRGATLRQLLAFSTVARHHSFMQAAAELHLTPSAVSLRIRELEQAAGMPLFDRLAKTVTLTPAGEVLLVDVQQALGALQHADDALSRLRQHPARPVNVGMVSGAKYFLPRLVAQFREQHRDVDMQIVVGNRDTLVAGLRRGDIDLAIMGAPPDELAARAVAFAEHPLGVIAAPEHPLARARALPPQILAEYEFIVREPGSGTRAALERFVSVERIELPRRRELTGNDPVKRAVMANQGLAFLSLHAAALELQGGLLVSLDVSGLPLIRHWHVVEVAPSAHSDPARALWRFIIDRGTGGSVLARGMATGDPAALH